MFSFFCPSTGGMWYLAHWSLVPGPFQEEGVPLSWLWLGGGEGEGVPLSWSWLGGGEGATLVRTRPGVPPPKTPQPGPGQGHPPPPPSWPGPGYAAGGMPLAVTQEDCLVKYNTKTVSN